VLHAYLNSGHVIISGPETPTLGQIDAIGVDEIQYAKATSTLPWSISRHGHHPPALERTIESFRGFFTNEQGPR